jgi:hypothetical protein
MRIGYNKACALNRITPERFPGHRFDISLRHRAKTEPYYSCATLEKRTPDVKRKFQIRRKS